MPMIATAPLYCHLCERRYIGDAKDPQCQMCGQFNYVTVDGAESRFDEKHLREMRKALGWIP